MAIRKCKGQGFEFTLPQRELISVCVIVQQCRSDRDYFTLLFHNFGRSLTSRIEDMATVNM